MLDENVKNPFGSSKVMFFGRAISSFIVLQFSAVHLLNVVNKNIPKV